MSVRDTEEYKEMTMSRMGQLTYEQADSEEEQLAFWQYVVDSGSYRWLEGWFGRQASDMIADGLIDPPSAPFN